MPADHGTGKDSDRHRRGGGCPSAGLVNPSTAPGSVSPPCRSSLTAPMPRHMCRPVSRWCSNHNKACRRVASLARADRTYGGRRRAAFARNSGPFPPRHGCVPPIAAFSPACITPPVRSQGTLRTPQVAATSGWRMRLTASRRAIFPDLNKVFKPCRIAGQWGRRRSSAAGRRMRGLTWWSWLFHPFENRAIIPVVRLKKARVLLTCIKEASSRGMHNDSN